MPEQCQLHSDMSRRVQVVEDTQRIQTDENAKLWKAINTIREEKATDSTILAELVKAVDELKVQMGKGFAELRDEIDKLKAIPAKRWDNLVSDVLKAIVSLAIGIIVTYLAIKGGP